MGRKRVVEVENRYEGWVAIGAAMGVSKRTAIKHAQAGATPRLRVAKGPFGRVYALRSWVEAFLAAGTTVNYGGPP